MTAVSTWKYVGFHVYQQNWEGRAKVLLWAKIQLCYIFIFCWTCSVFKISETWARSLKFNSDFRLLRLYKFNWLVLVYAHSKIFVDVEEWTFAESQSEPRNVISRVKGLLQYGTFVQLLMANHCSLVVPSLPFFPWKSCFTSFHSFFPFVSSSRSCRKQLITGKQSSYPSTCAAQSSLSLTARRARSSRSACPTWTCAGSTCAAWSRTGAARCRMH